MTLNSSTEGTKALNFLFPCSFSPGLPRVFYLLCASTSYALNPHNNSARQVGCGYFKFRDEGTRGFDFYKRKGTKALIGHRSQNCNHCFQWPLGSSCSPKEGYLLKHMSPMDYHLVWLPSGGSWDVLLNVKNRFKKDRCVRRRMDRQVTRCVGAHLNLISAYVLSYGALLS